MLRCWIFRKVIAHLVIVDQAWPERIQRHLQVCPVCRQFHTIQAALTRELAAEARTQRQSPSPFLHAKIMASLDRVGPNREPDRSMIAPFWSGALVSLGIIVIGALFIFNLSQSRQPSNPVSTAVDQIQAALAPVPIANGPALLQWSKQLEQPLESEMQGMMGDAQSTLRSLADNFLPQQWQSGPLAKVLKPAN